MVTHDVRHALRLFRRNPGFFAVSVMTIALAIGGCSAVFSVVNAVLLKPLPYPEPDQILAVAEEHPGSTSTLGGLVFSNFTYHAWAPSARTITDLGGFSTRRFTLAGEGLGDAERVAGAAVTPSLFRVLRAVPAAGRLFNDADALPGAAPVLVLGHDLWKSRFAGDPRVIGRAVTVDGVSREVVGITAEGFAFPNGVAAYLPYEVIKPAPRGIGLFGALARMAPGVTPEQARAEGTAAARSVDRPIVAEMVYGKGGPVEVTAQRLADRQTASVRPALLLLSVGIALVLVIACANVTNLFLSRGFSRAREMSVRAALGAGRGRLMRQLLAESLLLSAAGGAAGLLLGWGLTRAVPALAPASFPRLDAIAMDGTAVLLAAGLAVIAGTLSGLLPAWRGSRMALSPALRESDLRTATAGSRGARSVLLAAEAALAVILLIGSALLGRSFMKLMEVDTGYQASNVLTANLVGVGDVPHTRITATVAQVLERIRAIPGVEAAGAGTMAPFGGSTSISGFALPGARTPDGQPVQVRALSHTVSAGYAEALGMRLIEGRFINQGDIMGSTRGLMVNEAFVRTYLTDGRPVLGRRFMGLGDGDDDDVAAELIGVTANVLPAALDGKPEPAIYVSYGNGADFSRATFVIRTSGDPSTIGPLLRAAVKDAEPSAVALDNLATLSSQVAASVATPRFAASVLGAFAVLALVLAAVGLYGVLSYNVTTRRREIGVRAALGAGRGNLVGLVLRQGLGVTAVGLLIGVAAAALLTRLMEKLLFGVKPLDAVSFALAPGLLLLVAFAACAIPAMRAARVEPAEALRSE